MATSGPDPCSGEHLDAVYEPSDERRQSFVPDHTAGIIVAPGVAIPASFSAALFQKSRKRRRAKNQVSCLTALVSALRQIRLVVARRLFSSSADNRDTQCTPLRPLPRLVPPRRTP